MTPDLRRLASDLDDSLLDHLLFPLLQSVSNDEIYSVPSSQDTYILMLVFGSLFLLICLLNFLIWIKDLVSGSHEVISSLPSDSHEVISSLPSEKSIIYDVAGITNEFLASHLPWLNDFFDPKRNIRTWEKTRNIARLLKALKSKNPIVREAAAIALGELHDQRAVEPLICALREEQKRPRDFFSFRLDTPVYKALTQALGEIGDIRAVEPLLHAYGNNALELDAIDKIGIPAVEPLICTLHRDEYPGIRERSAEALGRIGSVKAIKPLVAALRDETSSVRRSAAEALKNIGWEPNNSAEKAWFLVAGPTWGWLDEVSRLGASSIEPLNNALYGDSTSEERAEAAEVLDKFGVLKRDIRTVDKAYRYFVARGELENLLIEALNRRDKWEGTTMAETYLNCGNTKLAEAARLWANSHGYTITSGIGRDAITWGSKS